MPSKTNGNISAYDRVCMHGHYESAYKSTPVSVEKML